jgi:NAD(P)-dependent dehydrogenase (short-subunit alcohol dehydrogenase family)
MSDAQAGAGTLHGRRAIVTGGGAGIGRAICLALAAAGAAVAVTDLNPAAAETVAAEISATGGRAVSFALDVTDGAAARTVFASAAEVLGGLEIVCLNAGVSTMGRVEDLDPMRDWDFNMDVNARGIFLCTQAAIPHLKAAGGGAIVATASMAGLRGVPLLAHYAASKWAVIGWIKSVAIELAPHKITCNCVCPGYVRTGMQERELIWEGKLRGMSPQDVAAEYVRTTPLGRMEEPEDVAEAVVYLVSPAAQFLTGVALPTTGGADLL